MLEALHATDFRNLAPEPVILPGGAALLIGANGAGKTSVLEAIGQLSGRPSFRGARPAEMAVGDAYSLRGEVSGGDGPRETLRAVWSAGGGRTFFRGEKSVGYVDMAEVLPAIVFSPDDRALILGAPSGRRRFLDRLAVTVAPAAADEIARFSRALAERNALLARGGGGEDVSIWTEEFIQCAVRVVARRHAAYTVWESAFARVVEAAGDPLSDVVVSYRSVDANSAEDAFRRDAERLAAAERRRRHTLFGPQRDDLVLERGGRPFAAGASSGEIARLAFYARFAEARVTEEARRRPPLYAVDEFDAHHAPAATAALLSLLPFPAQILLTSARPDAEMLCPWPVSVLEVDAGKIHPRSQPARLRKTG